MSFETPAILLVELYRGLATRHVWRRKGHLGDVVDSEANFRGFERPGCLTMKKQYLLRRSIVSDCGAIVSAVSRVLDPKRSHIGEILSTLTLMHLEPQHSRP
jgi:hypothetical protein